MKRTGSLVVGFVVVVAALVLASNPYFDPRASAYMFALVSAVAAAAGTFLVARGGMPGVGAVIAVMLGIGFVIKPAMRPAVESVEGTKVVPYAFGDMHQLAFVIGGAILLVAALVLFGLSVRRDARAKVGGQPSQAPSTSTGQPPLYPVLRDMAWPGRTQVVGRPLLPKYPPHAHNVFVSFAYDTGAQRAVVAEGEVAALEREAIASLERRPMSWTVQSAHADGRPRVIVLQDEYATEAILSRAAMAEAHLLLDAPLLAIAVYARGGIIAQDGRSPDVIKLAAFCAEQYEAAGSDRISRFPVIVSDNVPCAFAVPQGEGESAEDVMRRFAPGAR